MLRASKRLDASTRVKHVDTFKRSEALGRAACQDSDFLSKSETKAKFAKFGDAKNDET